MVEVRPIITGHLSLRPIITGHLSLTPYDSELSPNMSSISKTITENASLSTMILIIAHAAVERAAHRIMKPSAVARDRRGGEEGGWW